MLSSTFMPWCVLHNLFSCKLLPCHTLAWVCKEIRQAWILLPRNQLLNFLKPFLPCPEGNFFLFLMQTLIIYLLQLHWAAEHFLSHVLITCWVNRDPPYPPFLTTAANPLWNRGGHIWSCAPSILSSSLLFSPLSLLHRRCSLLQHQATLRLL